MSARGTVHVLHPSDDWYGADVVAFRTALVLRDAGYDVRVVMPFKTRASAPRPLSVRLQSEGVVVERMRLPVVRRNLLTPGGLITLLWSALLFNISARRLHGRLVLVNTSALVLCLPGLRLRRRLRVVLHLHETLEGWEGAVLGRLLHLAHRIITVSETAQSRLPRFARAKAAIVENAVDQSLDPQPLPPDRPLRYLFIGRWSPRKGIAELLDAWKSFDGGELWVLGGFPPDGQPASIDPLAVRSPRVRIVGEVADVTQWIDDSHVVVIPSLQSEGMPMVALEALSRGRPLAATSAGGLGDVVDDAVGWVLPPTPADWPAAFRQITADEVRSRQNACLKRHRERFSAETYQERITLVLADVIA